MLTATQLPNKFTSNTFQSLLNVVFKFFVCNIKAFMYILILESSFVRKMLKIISSFSARGFGAM